MIAHTRKRQNFFEQAFLTSVNRRNKDRKDVMCLKIIERNDTKPSEECSFPRVALEPAGFVSKSDISNALLHFKLKN
jgi:hypothetical protein